MRFQMDAVRKTVAEGTENHPTIGGWECLPNFNAKRMAAVQHEQVVVLVQVAAQVLMLELSASIVGGACPRSFGVPFPMVQMVMHHQDTTC